MLMSAATLTRPQLVASLFRGTYQKLRESSLGSYPLGSVLWLTQHKPDLMSKVEEAEAAVDAAALDFLAGRIDDAAFRAAGKAWYAAWMACRKALP